jgi:hypothetical protein
MVGNDLLLVEFQDWLQENCAESDFAIIDPVSLNERYEAARKALSARMPFEDHLQSHSYETSSLASKVGAWKAYIKFELQENSISRAERLYERALIACPLSQDLWKEYTEFALFQLKSWPTVESITARACRVFPADFENWKLRLHSLEMSNKEQGVIAVAVAKVPYRNYLIEATLICYFQFPIS